MGGHNGLLYRAADGHGVGVGGGEIDIDLLVSFCKERSGVVNVDMQEIALSFLQLNALRAAVHLPERRRVFPTPLFSAFDAVVVLQHIVFAVGQCAEHLGQVHIKREGNPVELLGILRYFAALEVAF